MDFSAFSLTPQKAALLHPWTMTPHPRARGIPWGIDLRTWRPLLIDPWLLKYNGIRDGVEYVGELNSLVSHFYGVKESGKTTLARTAAVRLGPIAAGRDHMRIWINSRKTEDGRDEYEGLTEALESHVIHLRHKKLNMFDLNMGLSAAQLHWLAINACETVANRLLKGYEPLVLQVAMFRMLRDFRAVSSTEVLEALARKLTRPDVDAYFADTDNELRDSVEEKLIKLEDSGDEEEREEGRRLRKELHWLHRQPSHLNWELFVEDAEQVSGHLLRILRGDLEGIIGGTDSLWDDLSQQAVTLDWTGMPDTGVTLARTLLTMYRTAAIINNEHKLIPHIEINDEEHEALKNRAYARAQSEMIKKIRGTPTWLIGASQHRSDYLRVGDAGSEQRELAEGMLLGVTMIAIGQTPSWEIPLLREQLGISALDGKIIERLPKGCFALIIGNRKPIFFRLVLTEWEANLSRSNRATDRMVEDRPEIATWAGNGKVRIGDRTVRLNSGVTIVGNPSRN